LPNSAVPAKAAIAIIRRTGADGLASALAEPAIARGAFMFKRIDHVEIVTDRPDETETFYTDVLGFRVKARDRVARPDGTALNLTYLDLGGTVVELIAYDGVPVDPAPRMEHLGYRMIAVEVEDMDKAAAYLKTKGVDIVWGPMVRDTYARAEIRDPNGYGIELRQWF
jgi:glyoxylase I family protein